MAKKVIKTQQQQPIPFEQALAIGGKMLIVRANRLSVDKLESIRDQRKRLEDELDDARRSYKFYADLFTSKEKMEAFLQVITDKGNRLKSALAELPEHKTLSMLLQEDEERTIEDIMLMLAYLNEQLNISEGLQRNQIDLLASDIATSYPKLRLEDILLCFKKAIKGEYGTIYNRLDAAVIHEWISAYERYIDEQRAEQQLRIHVSSK